MNGTQAVLSPSLSLRHGAHLVFLDALGCGTSCGAGGANVKTLAYNQVKVILERHSVDTSEGLYPEGEFHQDGEKAGISPFMFPKGNARILTSQTL